MTLHRTCFILSQVHIMGVYLQAKPAAEGKPKACGPRFPAYLESPRGKQMSEGDNMLPLVWNYCNYTTFTIKNNFVKHGDLN